MELTPTITEPGIYGSSTERTIVEGDLIIDSPDVTLTNMIIKGNLLISENVGEGDVTLRNVTVEGETTVSGGGENSIYFEDSILATVIVNKNTGAVRIVATGSTEVVEVQLDSPVRVEETGLDAGSSGFSNIIVSEGLQSGEGSTAGGYQLELVGSFETVNSRAESIRINLAESTDLRTVILSAAAEIFGEGTIFNAEINANGSTLSTTPQNLVLDIDNGVSVEIGEETVTENHSSADTTDLSGIDLAANSISVSFAEYVAGLTVDDFEVEAKLDGETVELTNLQFSASKNRITFDPITLTNNLGKELTVSVAPSEASSKLTGELQTATMTLDYGFSGRITDVQGNSISNMRILFREGSSSQVGEVVAEAVTDRYGYYSVNVAPGEYTGEFSAPGYITSYMYGVALTDVFNTGQNETAIRAAASDELKIMLTWNLDPRDLDSHLEGPTLDGEGIFHTWYADSRYSEDGITYVDLDWDDVQSYGPETTTIRELTDGIYRFGVHHYSGESTLRNSGATVKIFKGNENVASEVFTVPSGDGTEIFWSVFEMIISNNGEHIEIVPVNELSDFNPSYEVSEEEFETNPAN
ncbi:hypothetical protein FZC84_22075 [Rossellomorea vietnamensis]|uniref:SbsA Ig-like domain-containing protein n=1 Tax=Rossellomorea vietnamensis TaxID=218284 RepID=A0A5D4M0S0_9BACI|nr:carboxypeptidase regulatory-like domain-containing protein [Rossellomorea vietnamensis]TYR94873.1 hypothetical protein FZC84_22075 [Rossellomorea vietnamensis]